MKVLMYIGYIAIAIVILMLLVLIHELGHYVAGKIFKFKINEFSIGFGKAIYKHKSKKTGEQFSIRLIPLGGYCAFEGEDEDGLTPDSFNSQKWWKRLIVLFAGAFFNILFGLFTVIFMLMILGYDKVVVQEVTELNAATLKKGDIICEVDGSYVSMFSTVSQKIQSYDEGATATLTIIRDGKKEKVQVVIDKVSTVDEEGKEISSNIIGISTTMYKYKFFEALGQTWVVTGNIIWETLKAFGMLIVGKLGIENISGPFGIIGGIATGVKLNWLILFAFIPIISINLGVFNLLPIPALDGARMVFVGIEAIRKKPISRKIEGRIHTVGLIVLFTLVILVDVVKFFIGLF